MAHTKAPVTTRLGVACGCCSFTCPAKRHLTPSIKSMRAIVLHNRKKNA